MATSLMRTNMVQLSRFLIEPLNRCGLDQVEFAAELNQKGTPDSSGRLPVMYNEAILANSSSICYNGQEACPVGMTTKLQLEPVMHREVRRILENLRMEHFTHMGKYRPGRFRRC